MIGRYTSPFAQAEFGAPSHGVYGDGFRAALVSARVVYRAPTVGPGQTLKHRNLFGAFAARPATNRMVFSQHGYWGSYPLDQQPIISRPDPWSDETAGAP
jgi:hypothetical protein